MNMNGEVQWRDASSLVRQIQSTQLYNRQLAFICQTNGLKATGVKAELQRRITNIIQEAASANDVARFNQIKHSISNALNHQRPTAQVKGSVSRTPSLSSQPQFPMPDPRMSSHPSPGGFASAGFNGSPGSSNGFHFGPMTDPLTARLWFKESPFYKIEGPVDRVRVCEPMAQHRNSVQISLRLGSNQNLQRCILDDSYRVMFFCAGDINGVQNIAFPHQSEIRVNGGEVKANLRGLKNKPGSTRPVDITNLLRLKPQYTNTVDFTYALTSKKFYVVVNICRTTSVPDLVKLIKSRSIISKRSVIQEISSKAADDDIVATSQVLSLKCPLTYMRLDVPCRSTNCAHIQCFDATSYLQLQEQGPQWLCPICNKPAPFNLLAVDEYVKDILDHTSKSLETVTIEPDGVWSAKAGESNNPSRTNGSSSYAPDEEDDDDDLEISEISMIGGRPFDTPQRNGSSFSTPGTGREDSAADSRGGGRSQSNKRPAPTVIDLTLSSDEDDDEPIQRPGKRQSTAANGYTGPSNPYLNQSSSDYL